MKVAEICRKHGIPPSGTYYRWKATHRGLDVNEAREQIEAWRTDYNQVRPHSALGYLTPEGFAPQAVARLVSPPTPVALPTEDTLYQSKTPPGNQFWPASYPCC